MAMLLNASPTAETTLSSKFASGRRWLGSCSLGTPDRTKRHMDATAPSTTSRYGNLPGTESLTILDLPLSSDIAPPVRQARDGELTSHQIPLQIRFVKRVIDIVVA